MSTKAVEKVVAGNVPDLAPTPATTIGFEDIAPPSMYIVQRSSGLADIRDIDYGDLVVAQGADDPEPIVMWKTGSQDAGALFYPMYMYKTWSHSDGENLKSWPYGDTGQPPAEAEQLAEATGKALFRTYNYVVFVPEFDEELPVFFRLNSKSQRSAANKINMVVSRSDQPMLAHAFRVTTEKKEKGANKWAIPIVTEATATQAHVDKATELFQLVLPGLQARQAAAAQASTAPAI